MLHQIKLRNLHAHIADVGKRFRQMNFCAQAISVLLCSVCLLGSAKAATIQSPHETQNPYMEMGLEDLMNLTVTSISKRAQLLQQTAAAVHVITNDDIRRTGVTSLAEALRLAPGFMVGQHSAGIWSVSSRGRSFDPTFDNKLLVMIDGRSIYSPVFGGVYWDSFDLVLEDVDRIEVIRGPGSSVWGSNAVNGIVNIITKSSADTQGLMASALYGNTEQGTINLRYGGAITSENTWRAFAKYRDLDGLRDMEGEKNHDGLRNVHAGFRTDLRPSQDSDLVFQGDMTASKTKTTFLSPNAPAYKMIEKESSTDVADLNVRGQYKHSLGQDSYITIQAFLNHFSLETPGLYNIKVDTADLDFQHHFVPLSSHTAQWGLGVRYIGSRLKTLSPISSFDREKRGEALLSAFIQDEIAFNDGQWVLTLGSKFEHNDQTGLEILPTARLLWHATEKHSFWTAFSRSVRIPSLGEQDAKHHVGIESTDTGLPLHLWYQGNSHAGSENFLVWELGHRFTPSSKFFVDTALFATWADNLFSESFELDKASVQMPSNGSSPYLHLDSTAGNDMRGQTYGLEISATWKPFSWWRLHGWYAYFEDSYKFLGDGMDAFGAMYGKISPRHQLFFRSSMDLPYNLEADLMTRYVSELPGLDIPDYATLDARLGWKPAENVEISLVGKNLIGPRHTETAIGFALGGTSGLGRSCYLKLCVEF